MWCWRAWLTGNRHITCKMQTLVVAKNLVLAFTSAGLEGTLKKLRACSSFSSGPGSRRDSIERLTDAALQPASLRYHFRAENRGKRIRASTASVDGDRRKRRREHLQTEIISDKPVVFLVPFLNREFRCFGCFQYGTRRTNCWVVSEKHKDDGRADQRNESSGENLWGKCSC